MQEKKTNKALAMVGRGFIAIVLGAMVLMVFINAFARYAFSYNFPVFEELSRYLFVWVSFLGAMLAYKEGKHVGIDMLVSRLRGGTKLAVKLICQLAVFACLGILGVGSYHYFILTAGDPSPSAGIPFGMISGMSIILTIYMFIYTLRDTIAIIKDYKAGNYEVSAKEAELALEAAGKEE